MFRTKFTFCFFSSRMVLMKALWKIIGIRHVDIWNFMIKIMSDLGVWKF